MQRLRGSYALGVVSMDNTQEIVAARRGNPLVIGIGEGENMIASDITAIINRTKRYIILDDNEVAIVRPDSVVVMNEFGDTVEKEIMTVTWDMSCLLYTSRCVYETGQRTQARSSHSTLTCVCRCGAARKAVRQRFVSFCRMQTS